jgi:hypothetical protein
MYISRNFWFIHLFFWKSEQKKYKKIPVVLSGAAKKTLLAGPLEPATGRRTAAPRSLRRAPSRSCNGQSALRSLLPLRLLLEANSSLPWFPQNIMLPWTWLFLMLQNNLGK